MVDCAAQSHSRPRSPSPYPVNIEFVIRDWAAWAPTLELRSQWLAWAAKGKAGCPPVSEAAPPVAAMPAMSRRRLNPLGRMAAQAAYDTCPPVAADSPPVIYASRYGDASRSLALLADLVRGEPISPTAFGLSVHNAIGAMVSIARGDRSHHSALAAGASSAGAALVEAGGLLADGEREVVIVCYDAPLPGDYAAFNDEPPAAYAWAWRVAAAETGAPCLRLSMQPGSSDAPDPPPPLPFGLGVLRFGLSGEAHWAQQSDGQRWRLERLAAGGRHAG